MILVSSPTMEGTTELATAIEHVPTFGSCPSCGASIHAQSVDQLPLLRSAGYGAARRTVTRHCPACPWSTTVEVSDCRP